MSANHLSSALEETSRACSYAATERGPETSSSWRLKFSHPAPVLPPPQPHHTIGCTITCAHLLMSARAPDTRHLTCSSLYTCQLELPHQVGVGRAATAAVEFASWRLGRSCMFQVIAMCIAVSVLSLLCDPFLLIQLHDLMRPCNASIIKARGPFRRLPLTHSAPPAIHRRLPTWPPHP